MLLVFGFLASRLGYADLMSYKNNTATGKERISRHLTILKTLKHPSYTYRKGGVYYFSKAAPQELADFSAQ